MLKSIQVLGGLGPMSAHQSFAGVPLGNGLPGPGGVFGGILKREDPLNDGNPASQLLTGDLDDLIGDIDPLTGDIDDLIGDID